MSDALVEDYLARLEIAASVLPGDRRAELVEEISTHISEARAAGQAPDEASLRGLLDRLGDPDEIVAAAQDISEGGPRTPSEHSAASAPTSTSPTPPTTSPWGILEITAVVLLALGVFIYPLISLAAGLICLWASLKWTRSEKWVATTIVGGSVLLPLIASQALNTFFGQDGVPYVFGVSVVWFLLPAVACAFAGVFLVVRLGSRDRKTASSGEFGG